VPTSVHHPRYQFLRAEMVTMRKSAGLSQTQLAQMLRVGQSYVSKIERGDMYIELLLFIDWCAACGAAPDAVISKLK
jgi:transcriptional regulator with XRE-family HTH domain